MDYTQTDGFLAGNRLYLSYSGSAPTAANLNTLASDISAAWGTHLAITAHPDWSLAEVDCEDIATRGGAAGSYGTPVVGTSSGTALAAQVAQNIEFDIARRYRGGKPRIFLPPPNTGVVSTVSEWQDSWVADLNTYFAAFMSEITALSIGSIGTLAHVNLSYYNGFTNVTNSSGRTRAAPKYRDTALVDAVTGYAAKKLYGSQKRRRNATAY